MVNRKLTGNNRHIYVNPGRDSHEEALKVHGITSDFLKDKPKFEDIAEDLLAYLQGAEVLIHNAPFDLGFLGMEFGKLGQPRVQTIVASVTGWSWINRGARCTARCWTPSCWPTCSSTSHTGKKCC